MRADNVVARLAPDDGRGSVTAELSDDALMRDAKLCVLGPAAYTGLRVGRGATVSRMLMRSLALAGTLMACAGASCGDVCTSDGIARWRRSDPCDVVDSGEGSSTSSFACAFSNSSYCSINAPILSIGKPLDWSCKRYCMSLSAFSTCISDVAD